MRKLLVGQIGVGYWGPNLLRNLISNNNCTLKVVADKSKDRLEYVKNNYDNISVTLDPMDVLTDETIDAVIISTPVKTHYDLAMKALSRGKHVLVEKPMATTSEEVRKIDELSRKQKLIAMVGHTFLFNPAVRYIKDIIDSKELGDIRYIYCQRLNLGRIRDDVDALWNLAPHDISIIQYWLDDPDPLNVTNKGMDYVQNNIDDVSFMTIQYQNKVMAHIHVSWLDPNKTRKITVVGSKKMVVYDDIIDDKIKIYDKGIDKVAVLGQNMDFDKQTNYVFNQRSGDVYIPELSWSEPLRLEISHFIDCILKGEKCLTDANHARKVVKILEMDKV